MLTGEGTTILQNLTNRRQDNCIIEFCFNHMMTRKLAHKLYNCTNVHMVQLYVFQHKYTVAMKTKTVQKMTFNQHKMLNEPLNKHEQV